jgi:hypothetical protein
MSSFITDGGRVTLIEDPNGQFQMEWLEALHYRIALSNPEFRNTLKAPSSPQATEPDQSLLEKPGVHILHEGKSTWIAPAPVLMLPLGKWTLHFDTSILRKLKSYERDCGFLLGTIDPATRRCSIVDAFPSDLTGKIDEAEALTKGRVNYVGKWQHKSNLTLSFEAYETQKLLREPTCQKISMMIGDPPLPKLVDDTAS